MSTRSRWRITPVLVTLLAGFALLFLACGPQGGGPDGAVAAQLKTQADTWDQAILRKDAKAIADHMTADFRHIELTLACSLAQVEVLVGSDPVRANPALRNANDDGIAGRPIDVDLNGMDLHTRNAGLDQVQ